MKKISFGRILSVISLASLLSTSTVLAKPIVISDANSPIVPTAVNPAKPVMSKIININQADVAALMQLEGVGEKRAQALIDYRKEHGRFTDLEALSNIHGWSKNLIKKNKALMILE